LPERPSKRLQQFHIEGAIYGPLHQGPISRPHPYREPVLIGVPLELLADPTRWTSHRCRHRKLSRCVMRPQCLHLSKRRLYPLSKLSTLAPLSPHSCA
jgi:hypothetical protein